MLEADRNPSVANGPPGDTAAPSSPRGAPGERRSASGPSVAAAQVERRGEEVGERRGEEVGDSSPIRRGKEVREAAVTPTGLERRKRKGPEHSKGPENPIEIRNHKQVWLQGQ